MEQIHINNWKQIIYTIAAIQVGTGVTIIGVLSFIPLFLVELGLSDAGEAAFWAGQEKRKNLVHEKSLL